MPTAPPVDINCVDCFNALVHCFSPAHQLDRYYKDGAFSQCLKPLDDLKTCMKLKVASPEEAKVREAGGSKWETVVGLIAGCDAVM